MEGLRLMRCVQPRRGQAWVVANVLGAIMVASSVKFLR